MKAFYVTSVLSYKNRILEREKYVLTNSLFYNFVYEGFHIHVLLFGFYLLFKN